MADEPGQDPSSFDSSDGVGDEVVSEQELDDLLAEASALADEIAADVGEPTSESEDLGAAGLKAIEHNPATGDGDDSTTDVDAQLAEMEELLSRTETQLGDSEDASVSDDGSSFGGVPESGQDFEEAAASEAPAAPAEVPEPLAPAGDSAQPDAVDEGAGEDSSAPPDVSDFAEPQPDNSALQDLPSLDEESPDDLAAQIPADAGDLVDGATGQAAESSPGAAEAGPNHWEPDETSPAQRPARSAPLQSFLRRLSPPALILGERVAGLLEVMDRPTHRLSVGPRQAIGWFAIATLGTSLIVFLASLI